MQVLTGTITPQPAGPDGRIMGTIPQKSGPPVSGLLEFSPLAEAALARRLAAVADRLPTDDDPFRPEEARTLRIGAVFTPDSGERRSPAVLYRCRWRPLTLRDVLVGVPKPGGADRAVLASSLAAAVRSLHVHFGMPHGALRAESFVFFGRAERPDLSRMYVLDWAGGGGGGLYGHPAAEEGKQGWYGDAWALLMVLTEVAEWRPMDRGSGDGKDLSKAKLERKEMVQKPEWKNPATAKVFEFGFDFLDRDRDALEKLSHWEVKRFYDKLCELLDPSR